MTRTASHARCAIVEPTATMCVQNYAGTRRNVTVAENAAGADTGMYLRYLYNSGTTFQLIQSVERVSRR